MLIHDIVIKSKNELTDHPVPNTIKYVVRYIIADNSRGEIFNEDIIVHVNENGNTIKNPEIFQSIYDDAARRAAIQYFKNNLANNI